MNWLVANNFLYKNIEINQHLFDIWEDKFISSSITNNIVHYDLNHYKRVSYAIYFSDGNYESDLDATITDTSIEEDNINSSCIYSNIDNVRQNLTFWLLSTIGNIKAPALALDTMTIIISYYNKGWLVLLNDWKDSHYFTAAFLCLFLFRNGDHLKL